MKTCKTFVLLLLCILVFSRHAFPMENKAYGAGRLAEEREYALRQIMLAALEETALRLPWLKATAERFPDVTMFTQALEAEVRREQSMLQLFAAWGMDESPAVPSDALEVPDGLEKALRTMYSLAARGMRIFQLLEGERTKREEARAWAHMWGHELRQQLDESVMLAESYGFQWLPEDDGNPREQGQWDGD